MPRGGQGFPAFEPGLPPHGGPPPFGSRKDLHGFFVPARPARQEPPAVADTGKGGRLAVVTPSRIAPDPAGFSRWTAEVRKTAVRPGETNSVPRPALAQVPAPFQVARLNGKMHASFLHLREKLAGRRPKPEAARPAKPKKGVGEAASGDKPRRLGARRPGELLPPIGSFKPDEVLAINLSADGLAKAQAVGYRLTGSTELAEVGLTLTHLVPPDGLNAVSARERLFDLLPDEGFALNRVYTPYRPGSGRQDARGIIAAAGRGCSAERCFGTALIKWQPRLAACARNVKVGIIDTGFDKTHPAFAGVHYEYREFLPLGGSRASPQHGTGVLSLLAGSPDSGTPGLIPDASYVIANAFFADAAGQPISDTAEMVRALNWLKRAGVSVVNLSFAGPEDELVHHAVRELTKSGAVVIAAAGNEGPGAPPSYPAGYEEVIAVTAVDRNLAPYRYANRGDQIDLAAPGVDIWTAIPGARAGAQTGTSFAVPYVTAVVAVGLPVTGTRTETDALASKERALARLEGNVVSLGEQGEHRRNPIFGEGLVQAPASCEPPAMTVVAGVAAPAAPAEPWAGTVRRAFDAATSEPMMLGAWISTVRAVTVDGVGR